MIVALQDDLARAVGASHLPLEQVHRRRAHEIGDEQIVRGVVDLVGRADLLQFAVLQHRDLGRQRHRLDLVVRDVDDGRARLLMQAFDLNAHVDAQLGVEVGERLVEQEHLRLSHQCAAHSDALSLATRKLAWPALQQMLDLQGLRDRGDRLVALRLRARRASPCRTPCSRATDMFG